MHVTHKIDACICMLSYIFHMTSTIVWMKCYACGVFVHMIFIEFNGTQLFFLIPIYNAWWLHQYAISTTSIPNG